MSRKLDITDQRFGRLTAISCTEMRDHNYVIWKCKCDCGREEFVPVNKLKNGSARSCGCLKQEKQLVAKRFGQLVVIQRSSQLKLPEKEWVWDCVCDCGNIVSVTTKDLTNGEVLTCGCPLLKQNSKEESLKEEPKLTSEEWNLDFEFDDDWEEVLIEEEHCIAENSIITENQFGDLMLKDSGETAKEKLVCECVCKCGRSIFVWTDDLFAGKIKSCRICAKKAEEHG